MSVNIKLKLHFFFFFFYPTLHSYHKTMDTLLLLLATVSSIIPRSILIDIYEKRGVCIVPMHICNSIIHRDVTKRMHNSNLHIITICIIFYDLRFDPIEIYIYIYMKRTGSRNWHDNSMRKSFSWKVERGTVKGNERNIGLRYEGTRIVADIVADIEIISISNISPSRNR